MKKAVVLLFATVAVCFNSSANLQVTAASGGTGISADKAANAPSPQWTTLGNIVLKEGGGPNQVDFGPNGSVVLNAPSGFEFSTNGTVAFDAGKNITAATVTAAPSSITLSVTANNASPAKDTLTISGLQVRPTVGTPLAAAGNITKGTSSGMVFGNNVTFGALSEVAGIGAALTITTQPSTNAVTVTPFAQQPVVRVVDQFGNNSNTNSTDVVSASVNSGTGTLVGTTNIALVNGVATYTDLGANSSGIITILFSSGSLTSVVSGPVDVTGPPAPSALVIQTQPSSTATAGVAFAQQPAIAIYDQFGAALTNDNSTQVTAARLDGAGTLQGTLTATAVNGVATFTDLSHTLATNITIVFTSGFLSSATSSNITVVAANADHLAFSVEPGNAIAGLAFGTQPTVITLDQFNNPSSAGLATNLSLNIALTTGTGPLSGTTNIDIGPTGANGVAAFSNLSSAAVDGTNQLTASAAGFSDVTSAFFAVNPQVAAQLAITTQPSTNATAGAVFAQQPVVEVRDALGNLITSDNTTVVHAARGTGTGALVGTVDVTAVNGVATFTDISFNSVQTISLVFSSAGLTNATSGDVVVSAAPADRLVFTTQPAGGYAGSAFLTQPVLVTRDQFGNNSSVGLASNQVVTVVLTSGTGALIGTTNIDISTGTASFTDLGVNAAGPGKVITASSAGLTNALSGTFTIGGVDPASANISADTAVSGYTTISGPTYYEGASGDVGVGTIVLNAPAGYEFDATGTAPTVRIQKTSGPGNNDNIQGTGSPSGGPNNAVWPVTSVSTTQITFTVTTNSIGKTDSLTWQNIRIRALVGNPLGNGIVTNSGTATLTATDGTTSFANLQTVAGAAAQLVIQTQPSTNPPVGVVFAQQPVILVQDQFGNPRTTDNATVVTASRNLGMGDLQGTTNITAINGVVTFTNISYNVAEAITINFTSGALTPVTSALIQMGAGIVTHLVFVVEPGFAVVGFPFGSQPVVKTADAYGNFSTGGLPASQLVDIGLNLGSGLSGTTSKDIGTAAGNGTVSFTDLKISVVGETNQLVAVAQEAPISNAFSVIFPVSAVPDHLVLVQGDGQTGTVGSTLAINPIVQVVDTNGAPISGATVSFNVQSGGGSVGSSTSVTGTNGYASTTWTLGGITGTNTLVASAFGIGVPTNITFTATSVSDVAAQLVITTEPSSSAVAGVQFAQQPVVQIQDQYGNLVSGDNTTVVTAGSGVGATTGLLGTTGVTAVNGVVTYTNLSYNTAQTINLAFSSAGLTNATSTDVVVSPAVASQLAFTTQPSGSRTDSILNPQPVVVTQDQFGNASTNGLPASLSLTLTVTNGTGSLVGTTAVDVGSAAANGVATFTNVQVTAAGLGKQLLASAAGLTNAISTVFNVGGVDPAIIPVIPANGSSVSAVGPTYYEFASGDVGVGTIILNAPVGYQFDTSSIPTVTVKRIGGTGAPSKNINGASNGGGGTTSAVTSFTATQITFTINSASTGGVTDSITWNNIKVQAATGIPAALSDITKSGSSVLAAVVDNVTSFGALTSDPRPAQLAIQTEPSSSANAGVVFAQQPVVLVKDQFGNLWTNTSVNVTATRGTGTAALQGTTTVASVNGVATFANLSYNAVETITIDFSGNLLVGTTSSNVVVGPGIANHLVFSTQPGGAVYGNALNPQPVVKTQDQFGNDSTVGLGTNVTVTLSVSTGTGSLVGTSSLNIGTDGGNGTVSFSGLAIDAAGDKQLTAAASGFTNAVSDTFTIDKANQTITFGPLSDKITNDGPFTVSATNSSGLTIGFNIQSGPASINVNTVTLDGVTGTVTVRASNAGNANYNATFTDASFQVLDNPNVVIITQPVDQTVNQGSNATFTVGATGPALVYQWLFNGTNLSGATDASLTITNAQGSNAGIYSVVVTNAANSVTSSNATLTVIIPPSITAQPTNATAGVGDNYSLTVSTNDGFVVSGTQPFTYQWQKEGNNLGTQTTSALTLPNIQVVDAGNYTVVLANAAGSVTSAPIVLNVVVVVAPQITLQPVDQSVVVGGTATFTVGATGTLLNYQWRLNGTNLIGASSSALVISPVHLSDAGLYSVIVSNSAASVLSSNATLTVTTITNDIDFDGHADLLLQSTNNLLALWNLAGTNFFSSFLLNNGAALDTGVRVVGQGDFNHDGKTDILIQHGGLISIMLMDGTNITQTVAINTTPIASAWKVIGAADFNNDGSVDILFLNDAGSQAVWLMNGTAKTKSVFLRGGLVVPPSWKIVGLSDFNKDGHVDILWQNNNGNLVVWNMNGLRYVNATRLGVGLLPAQGWRIVGLVDLNADGIRDVLWQNTDGRLFTWFMDGVTVTGSNFLLDGDSLPAGWSVVGEK